MNDPTPGIRAELLGLQKELDATIGDLRLCAEPDTPSKTWMYDLRTHPERLLTQHSVEAFLAVLQKFYSQSTSRPKHRPVIPMERFVFESLRTRFPDECAKLLGAAKNTEASLVPLSELGQPLLLTLGDAQRSLPITPVKDLFSHPPQPYIGRADELARLDDWFDAPGYERLLQIHGEAGVGKSALLLHWANGVFGRHRWNVLGFDFQGYAPPGTASNADDAIRRWLQSLRPDMTAPADPGACRARFRQALEGLPTLLLLDNVRSPDHVREVLRNVPEASLVIVAGRRPMDGIGTPGSKRSVELRRLPGPDAEQLFRRVAGEHATMSETTLRGLVRVSIGLPLLICVLGARLREGDHPSGESLLKELRNAPGVLEAASRSEDPTVNVRAVLRWSVEALPSNDARRAFRLLGVHPAKGGSIDTHTAAILFDRDDVEARALLDTLASYHLLERTQDEALEEALSHEGPTATRDMSSYLALRYSRHDLLQQLSSELAGADDFVEERRTAWDRVGALYYGSISHAFDRRNKDNPMIHMEDLQRWRSVEPVGAALVDAAGAAEWFQRERKNFVALVAQSTKIVPQPSLAARLACSAFYFLEIGRHDDDWDLVEHIAKDATEDPGADELDRARSMRNRGRKLLASMLEEQEHLRSDAYPFKPSHEVGERARTLLAGSLVLYRRQRNEKNAIRQREALSGEVTAVRELADVLRLAVDRRHPESRLVANAVAEYRSAHDLARGLSERFNGLQASFKNWEASWQLGLAATLMLMEIDRSGLDEAEILVERSIAYASHLRHGKSTHARLKAFGLQRRGDILRLKRDLDAAAAAYLTAAEVFERELNDSLAQGRGLAWAGRTLAAAGKAAQGQATLVRALRILEQNGAKDEADTARGWLTYM